MTTPTTPEPDEKPGLMSPRLASMVAALLTMRRLPMTPAGDRIHARLAAKVEELAHAE